MSSSILSRASGLSLLLGAALLVIGYIPIEFLTANNDPRQYLTTTWVIVTLVSLLGEMLLLMGLPGIVPRVGQLGFVGFVLTFVGGLLLAGTSVVNLLIFPWIAQVAPTLADGPPAMLAFFLVASALFALGGILLGVATLRAGILPRLTVTLLIIGVVLNFAGLVLTGIVATVVAIVAFVFIALPFGWMGYALLGERYAEVVRADPPSTWTGVG